MSEKESLHANFDDFDISIYNLIFLGNTIETTIKSFASIINKVPDAQERAIWVATCSIVIIQTVSFLEEFDKQLVSNNEELNNAIALLKRALKPATKQIREWKELTQFRNAVLAHNLRDKKEEISVFDRGLDSYDIPKTGGDFSVLANCVSMIRKTFESPFMGRLKAMQDFLDRRGRNSFASRFASGEAVASTVDRLANEINANILELKLSVGAI
jgi:hypothetical protein